MEEGLVMLENVRLEEYIKNKSFCWGNMDSKRIGVPQ